MMKIFSLTVSWAMLAASLLCGADYFVEKHGSDANDGRTPKTPKATINAAVKLLRPGDTLTIGPGEFLCVWPDDAHKIKMMANGPETVTKAVFKIKIC